MQFDQLKRELVSLLKGDLKKVSKPTSDDNEQDEPLFVQAILDASISQKSRLSTFDNYDGTTDPVDHVEIYKPVMDFHPYSDAMKCRAFSIMLQRPTRNLFSLLTSYSILTWKQLRKAFVA